MTRRSKPKREKRDWRWYASFALNAVVAASMVLGTIFLFTGAPRPAPPTIVPPTESAGGATSTPASAPTTAPPAPTATPAASPKPDAHNLSNSASQVARNSIAVGIPAAMLFIPSRRTVN